MRLYCLNSVSNISSSSSSSSAPFPSPTTPSSDEDRASRQRAESYTHAKSQELVIKEKRLKIKETCCFVLLRPPYFFLVGVFAGGFLLCCQSRGLVQIFVPDFTLKPLQVHKHLAKMLPVKLEGSRTRKEETLMPYSRSYFNLKSSLKLLTVSHLSKLFQVFLKVSEV